MRDKNKQEKTLAAWNILEVCFRNTDPIAVWRWDRGERAVSKWLGRAGKRWVPGKARAPGCGNEEREEEEEQADKRRWRA